jgi:protease I
METKRVLVLVADGFHDEEASVPLAQLRERGAEITVVAPGTGEIRGKHGRETLEATLTPGECTAEDYDALLLPGGSAPEFLRQEEDVLTLVRLFFDLADRPVAAICHGPQILISAGVLSGRLATSYAGIRDDLRLAGAKVVDRKVVVDGRLITSRTPEDLEAFGEALLGALFGDAESPDAETPEAESPQAEDEEQTAVETS